MEEQISKLKSFFKKKKTDIKFKNAGEGHRLCDETPKPHSSKNQNSDFNTPRSALSESALRAGEAAVLRERAKSSKPVKYKENNSDTLDMEKNVLQEKAELEKAYRFRDRALIKEIEVDKSNQLTRLFFHCPILIESHQFGSYGEIQAMILDYLNSQCSEEPVQACSLLLHCRNKDRSAVVGSLNIIEKLLQNIIDDPGEVKYHRIRLGNEKIHLNIVSVDGAVQLLKAVGFCEEKQGEEDFLVISEERCDPVTLREYLDIIKRAEPVRPQLFRNTIACHKRHVANIREEDLPQEFFRLSLEEVKRQAEERKQQMLESGMLLTKEMRDNLKKRDKRKYRYVLIRVAFPNNWILQGTFSANESLDAVNAWVADSLQTENPFVLAHPPLVRRLSDFSQTILEADLAPCALLRLSFELPALNECAGQDANLFIKEDLAPTTLH